MGKEEKEEIEQLIEAGEMFLNMIDYEPFRPSSEKPPPPFVRS